MVGSTLKAIREKPKLRIGDFLVSLETVIDRSVEKGGKRIKVELFFNIDNTGDRSTTVKRVNVVMGPHVEVIDELRTVMAHSSIRYPEKTDSYISFEFPELVTFDNGTKRRYFDKEEELKMYVWHTHGKVEKVVRLPPASRWEKEPWPFIVAA